MRKIDFFFIHCSAGHSNLDAVRNWWHRSKQAGGRGWKIGGYHAWVDYDGSITWLYPFEQVTNGVRGHNHNSFHIAYRGGVLKDNVHQAADTRTEEQKAGILMAITEAFATLQMYQPIHHIKILGHRDASRDKNGNGVIESWERIKECPSFDAIDEYDWMTGHAGVLLDRNSFGELVPFNHSSKSPKP